MLDFVARQLIENGTRIPGGSVKTAWNGGEMLFPEQVEVFRSAFGVPILNRYGGRELGVMACQFQNESFLSVLRPWLYLEVVDDVGKPVLPGESGRMIWTSTICRGTPFLRYDVGDLASYTNEQVDESGVFALHELQGRVASLCRLPNGQLINNIYWNHLFKGFPQIEQFQVIVRKSGAIRILFKGTGFAPEQATECRQRLHEFLGNLTVEIEWVNEIPRTSQGKLVQVVREDNSSSEQTGL